MNRWWTYQKERFPLSAYIPLMATFGFSSISYSLHLHKPEARFSDLSIPQAVTAILTTLFWFMLLRIADEHKDYEEDMQYRPYRPVQRGLVKLSELRAIGIVLALSLIGMSVWVDWRLLGLLAMAGLWFTLMSLEFGVPKWLKAHPTVYLLSHMLLLPLLHTFF